jgi:CHAD domain-containing protein
MNLRRPILIESAPVHSLYDATRTMLAKAAELKDRGDDSVHSARQRMKRIRAALRLLRAALGDGSYRAANKEVRDASRPLTAVRDAAALLATLQGLRRSGDGEMLESYVEQAGRLLSEELTARRRKLTSQVLHLSAAGLNRISERLSSVPAKEPEIASARSGMRRVYKQGRAAYADARRRRATETLHEWRKQAKYLASQASLVRTLFGADLKKIRRPSQKVGTLLGEDHDLVLLEAKLQELHDRGSLPADAGAQAILKQRIHRRREKLQAKSFDVGKRLYRRSPAKIEAALAKSIANNSAQK